MKSYLEQARAFLVTDLLGNFLVCVPFAYIAGICAGRGNPYPTWGLALAYGLHLGVAVNLKRLRERRENLGEKRGEAERL